jgi:hypothetical protein
MWKIGPVSEQNQNCRPAVGSKLRGAIPQEQKGCTRACAALLVNQTPRIRRPPAMADRVLKDFTHDDLYLRFGPVR